MAASSSAAPLGLFGGAVVEKWRLGTALIQARTGLFQKHVRKNYRVKKL
jgi:hypothetical protein